jgi:hypothetical protein
MRLKRALNMKYNERHLFETLDREILDQQFPGRAKRTMQVWLAQIQDIVERTAAVLREETTSDEEARAVLRNGLEFTAKQACAHLNVFDAWDKHRAAAKG